MAFPRNHSVLQVFGNTMSDNELDIWTFRLRIAPPELDVSWDPSQVTPTLDDIKTDLTTWWNAIASRFDVKTKMTGFKFNVVGTDGRYKSESKTHQRFFGVNDAGLPGTNAAGPLPPQIAVAVTLRTEAARGYASRGRIYLPTPGAATLDSQGRLSAAARDNFATATAQLLTNLNNWPGIDAVADPGNVVIGSNVGAGAFRVVNRVEVGNVYDTQRRRRSKYTERRSAPAVVAS